MRLKTSVIAAVILVGVIALFVCAPKKNAKEADFNPLLLGVEYPAGEILQTKDIDTIEYPSFEDAVILSGYDSSAVLEAIILKTKIDGYEFSSK